MISSDPRAVDTIGITIGDIEIYSEWVLQTPAVIYAVEFTETASGPAFGPQSQNVSAPFEWQEQMLSGGELLPLSDGGDRCVSYSTNTTKAMMVVMDFAEDPVVPDSYVIWTSAVNGSHALDPVMWIVFGSETGRADDFHGLDMSMLHSDDAMGMIASPPDRCSAYERFWIPPSPPPPSPPLPPPPPPPPAAVVASDRNMCRLDALRGTLVCDVASAALAADAVNMCGHVSGSGRVTCSYTLGDFWSRAELLPCAWLRHSEAPIVCARDTL